MIFVWVFGVLLVVTIALYIGVKLYQGRKTFVNHLMSNSKENKQQSTFRYIQIEQKDSDNAFSEDFDLSSSGLLDGHISDKQTESPIHRSQKKPFGVKEKLDNEKENILHAIDAKIKLAQSYEISQMRKSDKHKAFVAYVEAAKLGCEEALAPLERIAEDLSSKEQKELSQLYKFFKNPQKEQYWNNKAQEVEKFNFK